MRWVFTYKVDEEGYVLSFKARIVVRGDLQHTEDDTYAATLAAKALRTLIAIAAAWDMDLWQRDAISAFTNAVQPGKVYCYAPEGYGRPGYMILLNKALYGLKTSPALWHNDFTCTSEKLGLVRVPGSPCVYQSPEVLCFFFVDDIVEASMPKYRQQLRQFDAHLSSIYEMHGVGELRWFLSSNIFRDRKTRRIWLNQASYIERTMEKFGYDKEKCPKAPMGTDELLPNTGQATPQQVNLYQQKHHGSHSFLRILRLNTWKPQTEHSASATKHAIWHWPTVALAIITRHSNVQRMQLLRTIRQQGRAPTTMTML